VKKLILTIEDDSSLRMLIDFILRKDYHVATKENGVDALSWLDQGNIPDLIITDVTIPGLDAADFVHNLRKSGYYRDIPLLILSDWDTCIETINCLQIGADHYLMKPFNPSELREKIQELTITPKRLFA
jgi:two-component system, chemotaxis family, chemotaxis protein CheY